MSEVSGFTEKLPSVISDPFKKAQIREIFIRSHIDLWGKWDHYGKLKFRNGLTTGEQEVRGASFDEVALKIKALLEQLES